MELVYGIITGAVGGVVISLSGYFKKEKKPDFDWKKMVPTVATSAIIGGIGGYMGLPYNDAVTMLASTGATTFIATIVENIIKAISRNLKGKKKKGKKK